MNDAFFLTIDDLFLAFKGNENIRSALTLLETLQPVTCFVFRKQGTDIVTFIRLPEQK